MDLTPVLIATGFVLIVGGMALLCVPAAVVLAGVLLVALAIVAGPKVER